MKNDKDVKRKKIYTKILLLVLALFIVIGASYAAFLFTGIGDKVNSVTTGAITMTYTEGTNSIKMENALPMSDENGKNLMGGDQVFDFTVSMEITGDFTVAYEVVAEKQNTSTLGNQEVKLYLERSEDSNNYSSVMDPTYYVPSDKETTFGAPVGSMIMDTGVVNSSTIYYYRLRMWVDEEYEDAGTPKSFTVKVNVYGTTESTTIDNEGPVCEFKDIKNIKINTESKIILSCTDEKMGINKSELQISDIVSSDASIVEIKGISTPKRITNGYQYEITILGKQTGNTNLVLPRGTIKDKVGNVNEETSKTIEVKGANYQVSYQKDNHVKSIGKSEDECTTTNDNTGCSVTLPEIVAEEGYHAIGWYNENNELVGIAGASYELSKNEELTAKVAINSHTVTYDYQTNGGSSATKLIEEVNYNEEVDLSPTATKEGWIFVGWNTSENAKEKLDTLTMKDENITLYAIYKKEAVTLTARFDANGATLDATEKTCKINEVYNNETVEVSCTVETPTITRDGYTIIGYNKNKEATTKEVGSKENLTLNSSNSGSTWFAITSKEINDLTITLSKEQYTYDGTAKTPAITVKDGEVALVNDVDYTINYSSNTTAGTANVTITGKGVYNNTTKTSYSGTITKNFTIIKATPQVTLNAESGTANKSTAATFTETANIAGSFTHTSGATNIATVSPSSYSSVAANTAKTVTVTGISNGTSTITITFTPTDQTNYETVNKTYRVVSDIDLPVWTLASATTENNSTTTMPLTTITLKINGTDTSGNVNSTLTANNIKILVGGKEITPSTKTLSSAVSITNGKQYTLTLNGITDVGSLNLIIANNTLSDIAGNNNAQTSIATGITIRNYNASEVTYSGANSGSSCTTVQCALDEISGMIG